ncbi:hypothetical protein [Virgisporangium aurantiacum]|uniref:Peptidase M12B domain-containing protein n=1 Tax=Virgisporangium aurantiacum TaxID=175570 RepID=A0A8J4DYC6_9ACTN|nr:hypothetical protein [Virgisporangium aurantiacum]GIJ55525.1 hypothetical protein Vau01_030410 [Virgisporangium aurantiacum]
MTTLSLREIAERHLDKTGDLSVNADVYGYIHRDDDARLFGELAWSDVLPGSGTAVAPTTRSLRRHLETVSGPSVDLVVFLVGHEPDFSGVVDVDQVAKLQYALQLVRDLYAQVDLGVRRIEWGRIPVADAAGFADITSLTGAVSLTVHFSGRPGAVDLFVVQTMGALAGRSPSPGPCSKDSLVNMSGTVVELSWTPQFTGVLIAHELGHYLSLDHVSDEGNLMCGPSGVWPFRTSCEPSQDNTEITTAQGAEMKTHCMINPGG